MAKKRKAVDPSTETPPSNRPRTRSSGPLNKNQPLGLSPKKRLRHKGPPGIPAAEFTGIANVSGSSKENNNVRSLSSGGHSDDEINSPRKMSRPRGSSDDDLDLLGTSPHKANMRCTTPKTLTPEPSVATKGTPRKRGQVVEVMITTPKSFSGAPRKVGRSSADSPTRFSLNRRDDSATPSPDKRVRKTRRHISRSPSPSSASSTSSHIPPPPTPRTSPSKQAYASRPLPPVLSPQLQPYLQSQKGAVLQALQNPPLFPEDDDSASSSAFDQLTELLNGTTQRHEGNSCLVLGPRGSGKSRLVDRVLASIPSTSTARPVIVRLSAHCQTNDRLAMREIARQVQLQTGSDSALPTLPRRDEEDPDELTEVEDGRVNVHLPPPSHLPMLISALPALGRPVVVVLDAFDGFAAHSRQALLYCLLDTAQSCRGGAPTAPAEHEIMGPQTGAAMGQAEDSTAPPESDQIKRRHDPEHSQDTAKGEHGLLVVGITSRVDCLTLLEKRVKSRFSHRVMRVKTLAGLDDFLRFVRHILCVDSGCLGDSDDEWKTLWGISVEKFLSESTVFNVLKETFAFVKDLRVLSRLLTSPIIALTSSSPWLTAAQLLSSASIQRCPKRFPFLSTLPYPHIALLIAAVHTQTSGHDAFNFEMLYDIFTRQVRTSAAAPVQIAGNAIGMMKVPRGIMVGAFEHLIATRVLQPIAAPASHITREFVRYRCVAERDEIKGAVEHLGQTNLKKWFYKAQ